MLPNNVSFYHVARDTWLRMFQFMAAIEAGKITTSGWPTKVEITSEPGKSLLPLSFPLSMTTKGLSDWAGNLQFATFAILAMAASGALDERYLGKPLDDADMDRRNLRCIWYMVRCAFAHPDSGIPKWNCNGDYAAKFTLPNSFTFDGASLNGQEFSIEQLGGWQQIPALLNQTDRALLDPKA